MLDLKTINNSWTLFLDRDGVINHEKHEDYILHKDEFRFYEQVTAALTILNKIFGVIVMVTNQKGVGRGLMTEDALQEIHDLMLDTIRNAEGRIDKVYYCAELDNDHPNRKPNAGMALQAKKDFPQIDFQRSVMVGNKLSDMKFGRNAGMFTVFVATTNPETEFPHPDIDLRFDNLFAFASAFL
jgi:histidinol-phosphate phosphatase family protein